MSWLFFRTKLCRIVIFTAALAHDFEARDLRLVEVHLWWLFKYELVPCYYCLREAAAEVCTVQVGSRLHSSWLPVGPALVFLHHVNFIALGTEYFYSAAPEFVAEPHRQALLVVAKCSRTLSIHSFQIFIDYFGQTYKN